MFLHVILIHSSEAVDLLRRVTATKTSPGLFFTGLFANPKKHQVEYRDCNVWLLSMLTNNASDQYCNFSNKEQLWYCDKPASLECENIARYTITRTDHACSILKKSMLFEKLVLFETPDTDSKF